MNNLRKMNAFIFSFLLFMLFFTIFAKDLYHMTLPKVLTGRMREKNFPVTVTTEDGYEFETTAKLNAVPKIAVKEGLILLVEEREDGLYVAARQVETVYEQDGWISIKEGLSSRDRIIIGADRRIEPGMKVLEVVSGDKKK